MTIKTFKYNVFENLSSSIPNFLEVRNLSLDVAKKAKYLVHHVFNVSTANETQHTSSTKTKGEVRGGGRKPWKQKGTGRARAGSIRSPLWKGGGIIFGPKMKVVNKKINKKEKQLALRTLIYNKKEQIIVFKDLENSVLTTTNLRTYFFKLNLNLNQKILIISAKPNNNLKLAIRNLKNYKYLLATNIHAKALLKVEKIIMDERSIQIIQENFNAKK